MWYTIGKKNGANDSPLGNTPINREVTGAYSIYNYPLLSTLQKINYPIMNIGVNF